jgi:hypothetical protein
MQYFNQTPSNLVLIKMFLHESKFVNFQKFLLWYWEQQIEESEDV